MNWFPATDVALRQSPQIFNRFEIGLKNVFVDPVWIRHHPK